MTLHCGLKISISDFNVIKHLDQRFIQLLFLLSLLSAHTKQYIRCILNLHMECSNDSKIKQLITTVHKMHCPSYEKIQGILIIITMATTVM